MECSLKILGFSSKVLKDRVNDNKPMQKVAIKGL
jgi:hypothetical protein